MTPTLNSAELLPCPFCGENAKTLNAHGFGNYSIKCWNCGVTTDQCRGADGAIAKWNRRQAAEMVTRLESAGWQDISTAPRNGSAMLCIIQYENGLFSDPFKASYDDHYDNFWCPEDEAGHHPTHWMPSHPHHNPRQQTKRRVAMLRKFNIHLRDGKYGAKKDAIVGAIESESEGQAREQLMKSGQINPKYTDGFYFRADEAQGGVNQERKHLWVKGADVARVCANCGVMECKHNPHKPCPGGKAAFRIEDGTERLSALADQLGASMTAAFFPEGREQCYRDFCERYGLPYDGDEPKERMMNKQLIVEGLVNALAETLPDNLDDFVNRTLKFSVDIEVMVDGLRMTRAMLALCPVEGITGALTFDLDSPTLRLSPDLQKIADDVADRMIRAGLPSYHVIAENGVRKGFCALIVDVDLTPLAKESTVLFDTPEEAFGRAKHIIAEGLGGGRA